MDFERSIATYALDVDDLASFSCCGEDPSPWELEAENYIRAFALRHAAFVLAFRDKSGRLAAVSAFDPREIHVPLNAPTPEPGWHIQVLALSKGLHNAGHSREIFTQTFDAMRTIAPERVLVTAHAHKEHAISLTACGRVGLTPLVPLDAHYWVLLGEVPE